MLSRVIDFFLMSFGISSDEERKQQREQDRWTRQREIAAHDAAQRTQADHEKAQSTEPDASGTTSKRSTSTRP